MAGEPAGRVAFPKLRTSRIPWKGRAEDKDDPGVWAVTWGELHVGARQVFENAGFAQVTHPSPRRFVLRVDFTR